jgi:Ca2+-binding RTX toxin-like protein
MASGAVEPAVCHGAKATLVGTAGPDRFTATRRRDVIVTLGGDDVVDGLASDDAVCTGSGADMVRSGSRRSPGLVDLGPGDDRVRLRNGSEIHAGPGDDRVVVDGGAAWIFGGPGDDLLRSRSAIAPFGYTDNAPCLHYGHLTRGVRVDLAAGTAEGEGHDRVFGFHCVHGTRFGDVIVGSEEQDGIETGPGYDVVYAGGGVDNVAGGPQADRLYLGAGDDFGTGEGGWDRVYGQDGNDALEGWSEGDYLDGGAGNDQLYAALFCAIGGNSYDTAGLMDDAGNELFGGPGNDYLVGDRGNDRLDGGPGYDWVQPGFRDGRVDWIENTEQLVAGCLGRTVVKERFGRVYG